MDILTHVMQEFSQRPHKRVIGTGTMLDTTRSRSLLADAQEEDDALSHLACRGRGDVVLFLSGADAYNGDASWSGRRTLREAVLRRAGIASGAYADLDDLCRHLDATAGGD